MSYNKLRYKVYGKVVPSVTTIIGRWKDAGGLIRWAWKLGLEGQDIDDVSHKAMTAGTVAHRLVDMHVHNPDMVVPDAGQIIQDFSVEESIAEKSLSAFEAYLRWADQIRLRVLVTEKRLVSTRYKFGGTLDAVLWLGGERSIGDWKTSNNIYLDYLLQLAAYRLLWRENNPNQVILGGAHLVRFDKETGSFHHRHYRDMELDPAEEQFLLLRQAYENDKLLKKLV
jgi:hypothetical protein